LLTKWFQSKNEYPVKEEVREVSYSAYLLLLQPTVYLLNSLEDKRSMWEEVREVSSSADHRYSAPV
jgi:hypothetical protein